MVACPRCRYENASRAVVCSVCSERLTATASDVELARRPETLVGRVVNGKYEIVDLLGEGGMGVVYKVRHLLLRQRHLFALKILHPRFSADKRFQARFLREVEVTMELTHENIIQIRDFGMTEDGHLFFTMDFFPGRSLKSLLAEEGALPPARVVAILHEVAVALREAHRAGVIHRDLKPDNILVDADGAGGDRVRVLDFGIAKLLETETSENTLTDGIVIGTPKYMSPEQASGEAVDKRSDLYALGVVTYEMLAGRAPFCGETTRAVLMGHLTAEPPPFAAVKRGLDVPPALAELVFELLAKRPDDRPASADELIRRLAAEPTVARNAMSARRRLAPYAWVAATAAAALGIAIGAEHLPRWFTAAAPQAEAQGARGLPAPEGPPAGTVRGREEERSGAESRSAPHDENSRRLRCEVCGRAYHRGEKVGNMCHGLPLLEVRDE